MLFKILTVFLGILLAAKSGSLYIADSGTSASLRAAVMRVCAAASDGWPRDAGRIQSFGLLR